MKISIFAFTVNDKFPIDIMYRQFKKHMKEEFEFIIFNDAIDTNMENNINIVAQYNNISCVRVPQNIHTSQNPSEAYGDTLNWAIRSYAVNNNCEIIVLMHIDVFPICEISISNTLGEHLIASTAEFRIIDGKGVNYLYPALTVINMREIKNISELDFGLETGLDVGGKTRYFIEKYPHAVKFLANYQTPYMIAILKDEPIAHYFKENLEICTKYGLSAGWVADGLYHYMAGSQWNITDPDNGNKFAEGHKKRMDLFLRYFY